MRFSIAVLSLLLGISVYAAEGNNSWSCEGVNSIGFLWQEGRWENQSFAPATYLFTIGSESSASLIFSGYQWVFENCTSSNIIRCSTNLGNAIVMSFQTGEGAVSSIVAASVPPADETASTFIERIQCSRVNQ